MSGAAKGLAAGLLFSALALAPGAAMADGKPKLGEIISLGRGLGEAASVSVPASGFEIQRRTFGVLQDPKLDAALDGLLQELRAAAPDGTIFIAYGVLNSMQSRDELAALIAHEYAHIALGHSKPTQAEKLLKLASGATNLYIDHRWDGVAGIEDSSDERRLMGYGVAMEAIQSGLMPNRSRRNETAADAYATDLLIASGYNVIGMIDFLSRMDSWESAQEAARERAKATMVDLEGVATQAVKSGSTERTVDQAVGQGIQALWGSGVNALNAGLSKMQRRHNTPEKRTEDVLAYLEKNHPDAERPELRPMPWQGDRHIAALFAGIDKTHALVAALASRENSRYGTLKMEVQRSPAASMPYARYALLQVYDKRQGTKGAIEELRQELDRPDSLYPTHFLVMDLMSRMGTSKDQVAALEQSRKALGDPPELLPKAVRIYRRAGNQDLALMSYKRCIGFADVQLQAACEEAIN